MKPLSFSLLEKPRLWQRSTQPFWDDEQISKGMLEAHLNPEVDAASRRHETIANSVQWLSTLIPAGGKILDLGCGPGLYTKRLSELGYQVTGVDYSKRSLAYARQQDAKTRYLYLNYLDLDFAGAFDAVGAGAGKFDAGKIETVNFDAVTLIYCDYAALTEPERQILLENVHRVLKPGGIFIFDVFTAGHFRGKKEGTSWSVYENGGFWNARPHICLEAAYLYRDNTVAVDQTVILTEDGMAEYLIWDTVYTRESLLEEVLPAGFQVRDVFGDVCGAALTDRSETICLIVEK